MPASNETDAAVDDGTRRGSTTLLLSERGQDHWLATQDGVPVEGHGETAASAAADYCRKVDSMDE